MPDDWPDIPVNAEGRGVRVTAVGVVATGTLRITWDDGVERDVDVSTSFTKEHPLLKQLADPACFSTARLEEFGGVEWANGIDMCPHALRLKADEQHAARMAAAE